jgi:hypothetical protein
MNLFKAGAWQKQRTLGAQATQMKRCACVVPGADTVDGCLLSRFNFREGDITRNKNLEGPIQPGVNRFNRAGQT